MTATVVHDDHYGSIIDWPEYDMIEIRWHDGSADLDGDGFNRWLDGFADQLAAHGRSRVLVDAVPFRMDMALMDMAYRDAHVIPRYNSAGVTGFAFLMPTGMPAVGAEPAPEGPADFPTAYFDQRAAAIAWLAR